MTASKGFTARAITLSIGTPGAGETFTTIVQVQQFSFNGQTVKYEDLTNLGSPTLGGTIVEETIPGTVSPGTATFSGIFIPSDAGQLALATSFAAQTLADFKLQLPTGPNQTTAGNLYTLTGYIQDMPLPDTLDTGKVIKFKCTIKLAAMPALTQGS